MKIIKSFESTDYQYLLSIIIMLNLFIVQNDYSGSASKTLFLILVVMTIFMRITDKKSTLIQLLDSTPKSLILGQFNRLVHWSSSVEFIVNVMCLGFYNDNFLLLLILIYSCPMYLDILIRNRQLVSGLKLHFLWIILYTISKISKYFMINNKILKLEYLSQSFDCNMIILYPVFGLLDYASYMKITFAIPIYLKIINLTWFIQEGDINIDILDNMVKNSDVIKSELIFKTKVEDKKMDDRDCKTNLNNNSV